MKKRLLSLLLTLSMVVSFFPGMTITASAADGGGKTQLDSFSMGIDLDKLILPDECTADDYIHPAEAFSFEPEGILELEKEGSMQVWIHSKEEGGECPLGQCTHEVTDETPIFLLIMTTLHDDYQLASETPQVTLTGDAANVGQVFSTYYSEQNGMVIVGVKFGTNSTKGEVNRLLSGEPGGEGDEPTGTTYKWSEIKAGQIVKPGDVIVNDTEDDFDFDIADRNYYDFIYIKSGEKCTVLDKYVAEWDFDEDDESDSYTIESDSWTWMKDDEGELILVKTADAKYIQLISLKEIKQNGNEKFTVTFTPEAGYTYIYIPEEDLCDSGYSDEELAEEIASINAMFAAMRQTTMSLPENLADAGMVVATNGSFEVDSSMMGMMLKLQKVDNVIGKENNHLVTGVVCFMTGGIERDITVAKTKNGTVTAHIVGEDNAEPVSKAKDRDTVSLTVVPADGYVLESLTVTDAEDNEVLLEDNNFIMPRSAVTVTAEFIAATYSVTVNITEATEGSEDPSACTDATVTLVPLTGDPLTTEHSDEGVYTFENVAAGTYNLVIEKGTKGEEGYKVKTILVEVKGENKTVDVSLPAMNVNSKVDVTVSGNSPITGAQVGGLNDLADDIADDIVVAPGATVDVDVAMNIETKMSTEVDTGKKADIEAKAQAQSQNLTFLDINITQTITTTTGGVSDGGVDTPIHDTTDLLKIVIPFDTANRSDFAVYRYHEGHADGKVQKLVESNDTSKERIEVGDGVIIMYVRYFSTYAIGYSEGNGTTPTPPTPPASGTPDYSGGSSSPNNSVTAPKTENGKVTITPKNASKGSTVKITATPDEGYELDTLTVTDKNGKAIAVTDLGNGTYRFIMPSGNVTVKATFRAVTEAGCAGDETCPIRAYTDISTTAWYHDGVHYCVENGLMSGLPGQLFAPNGTTTRAQIVTILWNLEGTPVEDYTMSFADVAAGQWYTEAVRWAAANGVVTGLSDEIFAPNAAITREQLVTILRNYAQYKEIDVSEETNILSYTDARSVSAWAMPAIEWACASGVISGLPDGNALKLDPQGTATRAQVATMMMNFCENIVK